MLSFWKRAVAAILVVAGPIRQHQILLQRAKEKRPVVDRPEYLGGRKYEKQQPAHFGSKSLLSGWAGGLPADYELLHVIHLLPPTLPTSPVLTINAPHTAALYQWAAQHFFMYSSNVGYCFKILTLPKLASHNPHPPILRLTTM